MGVRLIYFVGVSFLRICLEIIVIGGFFFILFLLEIGLESMVFLVLKNKFKVLFVEFGLDLNVY